MDSVEQQLVFAGSEHGKVVAIRSLFQQGFEPPALIFVQVAGTCYVYFARLVPSNVAFLYDVCEVD